MKGREKGVRVMEEANESDVILKVVLVDEGLKILSFRSFADDSDVEGDREGFFI